MRIVDWARPSWAATCSARSAASVGPRLARLVGPNPPYHGPVFVLTHYAHEPIEMEGGTTFFFVTDGIHSALDRARDAAGDRDISVAGGPSTVNQYLDRGAHRRAAAARHRLRARGGRAGVRGRSAAGARARRPATGVPGDAHDVSPAPMSRLFAMPVARVYPLYAQKVERKGRTAAEVDEVIRWLTGFDEPALRRHLEQNTTFEDFFADAALNPNASRITGMICGVRVEEIEDPPLKEIRYLDKLVDDLAKGKPMSKVLREDLPASTTP